MKPRAGFLKLVCIWTLAALMQGLDAAHPPKKHAGSCKMKELTALTKSRVEDSLKAFDEANGKHLGTWSPGFPELQVHNNNPLNGPKVQCSLLFMAQGLDEVLKDQKNNMNPTDVSLHKKLQHAISSVKMLTACAKDALGGECSNKTSPPPMPKLTFERKQWGHTLLKTSRDYLDWLQHKFEVKIMFKSKVTPQKYLEGSAHLL